MSPLFREYFRKGGDVLMKKLLKLVAMILIYLISKSDN